MRRIKGHTPLLIAREDVLRLLNIGMHLQGQRTPRRQYFENVGQLRPETSHNVAADNSMWVCANQLPLVIKLAFRQWAGARGVRSEPKFREGITIGGDA